MKDITIPANRIHKEIRWFVISFILAFVLNIFSIIKYRTNWTEIFTSLHILLLVSLVLYLLLLVFRGLARLVRSLIFGKKD